MNKITERKTNELFSTRKIKLENREEIKSDLIKMLKEIIKKLDKLSDYNIYKSIELCEFISSSMLYGDIWEEEK